MSAQLNLVAESVARAHLYFEYTNGILGLAAFDIGLACISTNSPKLYGSLSLLFVVIAWGAGLGVYRQRLRILRNVRHNLASPLSVWRAVPVAFLGMTFLAAVAFGILNNEGIVW